MASLLTSRLVLRAAQLGILVIFLALGFIISLKLPLTNGRDELAHFRFARFIAEHGRLPLTESERKEADYKSEWPPLFHILVGMAGQGIDLDSPPFIKVAKEDPRVQLVIGMDNLEYGWLGRALTTEDPYQSEVLLWYLGRWLALLSGAVGLIATYLLISSSLPDHSWLALGATAVLGFIPNYVRISSVIGYDPLLVAPIAFYFLLLFYTVQHPTRPWPYLGLGLLMGLAGLTKYTPLSAVIIVPLFIIGLARRDSWAWRRTLGFLALYSLGLMVTFGSWVLYAELYFNRVAELGWLAGLLYPFIASDIGAGDVFALPLAGLVSEGGRTHVRGSATFFEWLWAVLNDIFGQAWLILIFIGVMGLALIGALRQWQGAGQKTRLWLGLLGAHMGLFLFFPLLRFVVSGQADDNIAAGQHILFPIGAPMALLLAQGLRTWLTERRLTHLLLGLAALCLWQNGVFVSQIYNNAPWPIQTVPLSRGEEVLARFDNNLALLGYELSPNEQTLAITLQWRADDFLSEDYHFEITLLDAANQAQSRWLGQPLNGLYPTRAWSPGDRVRDLIYLPLAGLSPGKYEVQLRLLSEAGQAFPPILAPTNSPQATPLVTTDSPGLNMSHVTLTPAPSTAENTLQLAGQEIGYILWQQNQPAKEPPRYLERAAIVFSTREDLGDEIRLSLIGPDEILHEPVSQVGQLYIFNVSPRFVRGEYRLRLERWAGDKLVAQAETPALLRVYTFERQFEAGPISQPLSANFAGQIGLLGYDLPQRRVQPGEALPITLHWQALKTMNADFIMFSHLINEHQEVVGGRDRRVREVYSTLFWVTDEVVTDAFNIQVKPDAPAGIYRLLVGFYLPVGEAPISLPLMQKGQLTDITHVNIGPIKVGRTPPDFTLKSAKPQVGLNQPLGDRPNLTLLGYDLTDETGQSPLDLQSGSSAPAKLLIPPGYKVSTLNLTVYWRSESELSIDYTTFVHLRNRANETIAQKDQPPLGGAYPTSLWDPGEIIADKIILPLPADLPAGEYQIVIGLYDFYTGQRLTVPGHPANEISLTNVTIP